MALAVETAQRTDPPKGTRLPSRAVQGTERACAQGLPYAAGFGTSRSLGPLIINRSFKTLEIGILNLKPGEGALIGGFDPASGQMIEPMQIPSMKPLHRPSSPYVIILKAKSVEAMELSARGEIALRRIESDGRLSDAVTVLPVYR